MSEVMLARLLDIGFSLLAAGIERNTIVGEVARMEEDGATPEEITAALQSMRKQSEDDAQLAIDGAVSG